MSARWWSGYRTLLESVRATSGRTAGTLRTNRLVKNALALIISGGGTGVIGIAFWAVAARRVSAATVGRTSAEIAAMILLATLAQLSFGSTFERFLPIAGDSTRRLVTNAYLTCTSLGLILAVVYVWLGEGHRFLPSSLFWRGFFVASVVLWTIFALQDSVLIGLRASRWVPVENILYSLAKLALIPLFVAVTRSNGVFVAWQVPVVLVIVVVNWFLFRRFVPEHQLISSPELLPSMRELIVLTGAQYSTLLITVISGSVTSLIVIDRLGAVASAHYYLPAQLTSGVAAALWSVNRSFLVEASAEPDRLALHARVAMRSGVTILVAAIVPGVIFAPWILEIFGHSYSQNGSTLLRLLLLCLPGNVVTAFYASFAWIDRKVWRLTVREIASAALFFALLFTFIGRFGILSIGIISLFSSAVQAVLFLPLLMKRYRRAMTQGSEALAHYGEPGGAESTSGN